ncbi:MAG: MFS transporter [Bacteroidetes bacterium]|uniref:MFS transporter n=1 Tax=Candidatus Enterocola intestinipullorum TaxID=2840783 RepID=A0A9D9H9M3_9BACT|nr:MFS transporter [Candidatus Enterocola intestinipullorum]
MSKGKNENPLLSLLTSIIIPAVILSKFANEEYLGVVPGFIIALAFPVGQGLYEIIKTRKPGFISIIGLASIFLTGIIGILQLPTEWLAFKEASVPLLIGMAVVLSLKTRYPLVKKLFFNDSLLDMERIGKILDEKNARGAMEKTLKISTYMIGGSFLLSAVLNFILAKVIVTSPSGTEAFNAELGRLTALSYPVIALPSTIVMCVALWYLFAKLKKLTGLEFEELIAPELREK